MRWDWKRRNSWKKTEKMNKVSMYVQKECDLLLH